MRAASFETQQYCADNREVYHLFKDLVLTKTEGTTWFEKVTDGDGRVAHLLLREHYVGESHNMRHSASAQAKLEGSFWKNEAAFPFEKFLTRMNEAFKELEDAGQPLYSAQKVSWLLRRVTNNDIQVQTTLGIIRDRYLTDFDAACITLSRTVSTRFVSVTPGRHKRSIGAVNSNSGRSGRGGRVGRSQKVKQVLWYGSKLKMSLINPNQIRHYGLAVSDDPTDKTRDIGISGDDIIIPFEIKGTTVFFKSRLPTRWEMANCRTVELTVDSPWNPAEVNTALIALLPTLVPSIEVSEYRKICAMEGMPRTDVEIEVSDLSVFDPPSMV
jgi:hypothetical protein